MRQTKKLNNKNNYKICNEFVMPIINTTKKEHGKEYII